MVGANHGFGTIGVQRAQLLAGSVEADQGARAIIGALAGRGRVVPRAAGSVIADLALGAVGLGGAGGRDASAAAAGFVGEAVRVFAALDLQALSLRANVILGTITVLAAGRFDFVNTFAVAAHFVVVAIRIRPAEGRTGGHFPAARTVALIAALGVAVEIIAIGRRILVAVSMTRRTIIIREAERATGKKRQEATT
jgi:hypothetical protein